jgi:hypothetical protein
MNADDIWYFVASINLVSEIYFGEFRQIIMPNLHECKIEIIKMSYRGVIVKIFYTRNIKIETFSLKYSVILSLEIPDFQQ